MSTVRPVQRLRPLTEEECYARLYGDGEPTVTVIRRKTEEEAAGDRLLADRARRAYEARLEPGERGAVDSEAA